MKASAIASQPELSSVLARLMISINDIAIAADANDLWADETDAKRKPRQNAARQYFVRILLSHVNEALEIVREIAGNANLRAAVDKCDGRTVADFKELETISNREREHFRKFRSRATFHYDKQLPDRVLKEISKNAPDQPWSYSMGRKPIDWKFELADAIIDRMVIREVMDLKIPKSAKRTELTAEIAGRLQDISRKYTSFAAHFVHRHCR